MAISTLINLVIKQSKTTWPEVPSSVRHEVQILETQMYRTDFWTLWEKARVGSSERIALKQVYYQG